MDFKTLWTFVLDAIFPSFCVSCEVEGNIFCDACLHTLELPGVFCCPVCHEPSEDGTCCLGCRALSPIERHVAMMPLAEGALIHRLVHLYKYQYLESLEPLFASLVTRFFSEHQMFHADYIIPVPLHRKRFVERGFNQSERVASMVSRATNIPFLNPLMRVKHTTQQATLDRQGRLNNVVGAFSVTQKFLPLMCGKKFVIVDDVFTTGSTIFECARALMRARAGEISGFSIARG